MSDQRIYPDNADEPDEAEATLLSTLKAALENNGTTEAPIKQVNFILRPGAIVARTNSRVVFVCG